MDREMITGMFFCVIQYQLQVTGYLLLIPFYPGKLKNRYRYRDLAKQDMKNGLFCASQSYLSCGSLKGLQLFQSR